MNRVAEMFRRKNTFSPLPHQHDAPRNFTAPTAPLEPRALQLDIVVGSHCPICESSLSALNALRAELPNVNVQIIDLDAPGVKTPPNVIAIPTVLINGYVVATGNPAMDELKQFIRSLS